MQRAVGRGKEMDHLYGGDRDQDRRSAGPGFLLTASCLLPSLFSVSLCLCGKLK
jgi:hypothetical protein